jgi:hypothetical protein
LADKIFPSPACGKYNINIKKATGGANQKQLPHFYLKNKAVQWKAGKFRLLMQSASL